MADFITRQYFEPGQELRDLPDTFIWKRFLYDSLVSQSDYSKDFGLDMYQTVLFTGGPGNGKHVLCEALKTSILKELQKESEEEIRAVDVYIDCRSMNGLTKEELSDCLKRGYESIPENRLTFISFEQVDRYDNLPFFFADIYPLVDDENVYTFFFLEDYELAETVFLKDVLICRCNAPSDTMRKQYLTANLSWNCKSSGEYNSFIIEGDSFSTDDIVRETAGYSYWDLEQFIRCLKREAASHTHDTRYAKEVEGSLKITLPKEQFQMYLDAFRPAGNKGSAPVIINSLPVSGQVPTVTAPFSPYVEPIDKDPEDMTPEEWLKYIEQNPVMNAPTHSVG